MDRNTNTTRSLSRILEKTKDKRETDAFIKNHVSNDSRTFCGYFNETIAKKGLVTSEVIERSSISKNYVYNILNGVKNPGRDKVIALCIGAKMSYSETQRALEICALAPLYPKDERDVRISVAINNEIFDVLRVNLILEEYGLAPLKV